MELIPADEYQQYSELVSNSKSIWEKAKKNHDFEQFAPTLEEVIGFKKKFADYTIKAKGGFSSRYDKLLNDYEEGFTTKQLDEFFSRLKEAIVPLVQMVVEKRIKFKKNMQLVCIQSKNKKNLIYSLQITLGLILIVGFLHKVLIHLQRIYIIKMFVSQQHI